MAWHNRVQSIIAASESVRSDRQAQTRYVILKCWVAQQCFGKIQVIPEDPTTGVLARLSHTFLL